MVLKGMVYRNPISSALYNAAKSLWLEILQKGKFIWKQNTLLLLSYSKIQTHCRITQITCFAAVSSSCPSPMTTYVHLRPNLDTILSKQLSLPGNHENLYNIRIKKLQNSLKNFSTFSPIFVAE